LKGLVKQAYILKFWHIELVISDGIHSKIWKNVLAQVNQKILQLILLINNIYEDFDLALGMSIFKQFWPLNITKF